MKLKNAKRIARLDRSSLGGGIISDWFDSLEQVETFEQYLQLVPTGSMGRKLAELQLELDSKESKSRGKTEGPVALKPDQIVSHWFYIERIFLALNSNADELNLRAHHRLELSEVILEIRSLLPSSNSTAIEIEKIAKLLVRSRECISSNLRELQSLWLTRDRISKRYADLLIRSLALELEELEKRTKECADAYRHALKELRSRSPSFDEKLPAELCEIDFDAVAEGARSDSELMCRKLSDLACAETLIALDEIPDALEKLRPYLEADHE